MRSTTNGIMSCTLPWFYDCSSDTERCRCTHNVAAFTKNDEKKKKNTALLHRTEQAILQRTKKRGVFHAPSRLSEAGHNPLTKRANSTTLNAQRTGTGLGWDPDMRCNVPTTTLPGPHPTVRKRNSAAQEQNVKKKKCIIYILRSRHI